MFCGLCKHFYSGEPAKDGRVCNLSKLYTTYINYACPDYEQAPHFFCLKTSHFISKEMCIARKKKKLFSECAKCKIGIYHTPLTINNQKIKKRKQIIRKKKPLIKRRK